MEMKINGIRKSIVLTRNTYNSDDCKFHIDVNNNRIKINRKKYTFLMKNYGGRSELLQAYNSLCGTIVNGKFGCANEYITMALETVNNRAVRITITTLSNNKQYVYFINEIYGDAKYSVTPRNWDLYVSLYEHDYSSFEAAFKSLMNLLMISVDMDKVNAFLLLKNIKGDD